jgi:hypothetical protein
MQGKSAKNNELTLKTVKRKKIYQHLVESWFMAPAVIPENWFPSVWRDAISRFMPLVATRQN